MSKLIYIAYMVLLRGRYLQVFRRTTLGHIYDIVIDSEWDMQKKHGGLR